MQELDLSNTYNCVPALNGMETENLKYRKGRMALLEEIDLLDKKNSISLRRRQSWYNGLECGYEEISEKLKSKPIYPMDEFYKWLKTQERIKIKVIESRQATYRRTLSEDEYVSYKYSCGVYQAYFNVLSILEKRS